MIRYLFICTTLILFFFNSNIVFAQDPVKVSPDHYKVIFENSEVRVLQMTMKPGEKDKMHSHPALTAYVEKGGKFKINFADGTEKEVEAADGVALYQEPVTHWVENIGTTNIRIIVTEMKK